MAIHRASWNLNEYIPLPIADYAANVGSGVDASGQPVSADFTLPVTWAWDGVFGWNRSARLRDVTDGTSTTLAIGERWVDPWHMQDDYSFITSGVPLPAARRYMGGDVGIIGGPGFHNSRHAYWGPNTTPGCRFDFPPGVPSATGTSGQGPITSIDLEAVTCPIDPNVRHAQAFLPFGSFHTGIVHFLMCDGSVRSIADTIDTDHDRAFWGVYQKLATRNGGEVIGEY